MARTGRPRLPLDEEHMKKLRCDNWTLRQIGDLLGVAHTTIARRLSKLKPIPKQEVIVIKTDTYTQYIVVGRKVHTVFNSQI